jgi:predicted DCC family thiol-disulfide oxidoreductase YuxK
VNTEITDNSNGWVFFDAECSLCTNLAHRFGPFLHRHRFTLVPLQTPWVEERLAKTDGKLLSEMRLLTTQGDLYGGADALIGIAQRISWTRPLYGLLDVPIVRSVLRRLYRWTARHRTCLGGGCRIAWGFAGIKTLLGAALLWVGVPLTGAAHPLVAAWAGMIGIVLLLHFGLFHLLSLLWRALGIDARPIMQSPAVATSLSKFWGRSWNTAFTDLTREHVFTPVARYRGPYAALATVFIISGWLHEVVISLPAHGGYGLPTIYFAMQGLGLLFEHSKPGRALGLGAGWKGWCFVAVVAGIPAFWLFPPVFIRNVILPMLHAIVAI